MNGNKKEKGFVKKAKDFDSSVLYSKLLTDEHINERREKSRNKVPGHFIIILFGAFILLGYLMQLQEDNMPKITREADVPTDSSDIFSEETAWRYLHTILGGKPRVAGTPHHLKITKDLKALVDSIAMSANQRVKTDWQLATGDYKRQQKISYVNYYQNVSNVIALLEGESGFHPNGTTSTTVLINCHYDSVPYALGVSDDAIFCATMVEILSRLSKRRRKFIHNIIFIFNGGEEYGLRGSAGFLQHPWSHGVTSVVNLDAVGMNGKPTIFQVSDPRVLEAYKRSAPSPNAQSIGQFVFTSSVVPSDTDFRIWKDFGKFQGIDIAFTKWCAVYHTRYDHPALLKPGVIQWAGNMLLPLVTQLGNMDELSKRVTPKTAIYYDYLNMFLVTYSLRASHMVDIVITLVGFASVLYYIWIVGPRMSTIKELLFSLLGRCISIVAGIAVTAVCVLVMVATTVQLRYLSQPWVVVPLYWMPYALTAVATSRAYDTLRAKKSGLDRSTRCLQAMAATRLLMCAILILLLCIPKLALTRYIVSAPLFIMSIAAAMSITVATHTQLQAWHHLIMEFALCLPSALFLCALALRFDALMLPTMGRTPTNAPDYVVAAINVGLAIAVSTTISGVELLFSRRRLWLALSALGTICVVLMFIPFSPYSDNGPAIQRHYWFITTYNSANESVAMTTGVLVTKQDAYTTQRVQQALRSAGINLNTRTDFAEDCAKFVFCDLPLLRTSFAKNLAKGLFLYTGPPADFKQAASTRLLSKGCLKKTCTYTFVATGAPHNILTLWPHQNVNLTAWTFASSVQPSFSQLGRPVYVIYHTVATYSDVIQPLIFNLTLNVPVALQFGPVLDLSHHSNKIWHPEDYTAEYARLVASMPAYFNIASIMSFRNNYVF